MIPKSLTIKGLYSYQTEQTIDFAALAAGNLFGIFGKVGAGKSSILEAIMYALYGEVERLGVQGRSYNMLNLSSHDLLILFYFDIGSKHYLSKVTGRRNSRDFSDVKIEKPVFFEKLDDHLTPLSIESAESLIGLKMSDFKKTIIIPQGTFQAFLQLGDTERTRMMRELFGLERYELEPKAKILQEKNDTAMQILRGQRSQLGDIDEKLVKEKMTQLTDLQKLVKKKQTDLEAKRKTEISLNQLKTDFDTWSKLKMDFDKLTEAEPQILSLEKQVADFEFAYLNFKNALDNRQRLQTDFDKNQKDIAEKTQNRERCNALISDLTQTLNDLTPQYQSREMLKKQAIELQKIGEIQALNINIEKQEERFEKGNQHLSAKSESVEALKKSATEIEKRRTDLRSKQPDPQELNAVKDWFSIFYSIQREMTRLEEERKILEEKLQGIEKAKYVIAVKDLPPLSIQAAFDLKISEILVKVKTAIGAAKQAEDKLNHELVHLKASEKLETLATELVQGEPCPLCGATHHPSVLSIGELNQKVKTVETQLLKLKATLRTMENIENQLNTLLLNFNHDKEALQKVVGLFFDEKKKAEAHDQKFMWAKYDSLDYAAVEKAVQSAADFDSQMRVFENELKRIATEVENAQKETEKYRKALSEIQSDLAANRASAHVLTTQIQVLVIKDWLKKSADELSVLAEGYENQFVRIEMQFKNLEKQIQTANAEAQILRGGIATLQTAEQTLAQDLEAAELDLAMKIVDSPFENLTIVESILKTNLDLPTAKLRIQQFNNQKLLVQAREQELAEKLSDKNYDVENHTALRMEIQGLETDIEEKNQNIGSLKTDIADVKNKLEQIAELNKKLKELDFRNENLKILRGLFQRSGFVNYASSMFLQSICAAANERFAKLTKQKLRLEITESNSFTIRDMVNNVQLRDVRTLSGGQTFQAALSLALALSDHIQSRQALPQKFFFLDEGFGSLDRDALSVVFDTLKSLQREQRIVGVISHVEDMQQEIDRYLQVDFDERLGSQVHLH